MSGRAHSALTDLDSDAKEFGAQLVPSVSSRNTGCDADIEDVCYYPILVLAYYTARLIPFL